MVLGSVTLLCYMVGQGPAVRHTALLYGRAGACCALAAGGGWMGYFFLFLFVCFFNLV